MTKQEQADRAAFEEWHRGRYPAVTIRKQNLLNTYTSMQVECNFEAWLACAEHVRGECAKDIKLLESRLEAMYE